MAYVHTYYIQGAYFKYVNINYVEKYQCFYRFVYVHIFLHNLSQISFSVFYFQMKENILNL